MGSSIPFSAFGVPNLRKAQKLPFSVFVAPNLRKAQTLPFSVVGGLRVLKKPYICSGLSTALSHCETGRICWKLMCFARVFQKTVMLSAVLVPFLVFWWVFGQSWRQGRLEYDYYFIIITILLLLYYYSYLLDYY